MCFTSNVWMVGFVKGVAYAKQMVQQIWEIKTWRRLCPKMDFVGRSVSIVDCRLCLCARPPLWRLSPWGFAKALQAYLWSCEGLKRPMFGYNKLLSVSRFHDWEWTSCRRLSKLCIFLGALCDVNLATKVANAKTPKGDSCHIWCNDPNTPVHVSPVVGSQKGSWTTELYSWPKKGWTQNLKWEALWLFEEFAKSRDQKAKMTVLTMAWSICHDHNQLLLRCPWQIRRSKHCTSECSTVGTQLMVIHQILRQCSKYHTEIYVYVYFLHIYYIFSFDN